MSARHLIDLYPQVAFTIREVRELLNLPSVGFESIDPRLLPPDLSQLPRTAKRLTQLLSKGSSTSLAEAQKSWSLDFLLSPTSFKSFSNTSNNLASIDFAETKLEGPSVFDPSARVSTTEGRATFPASLAFRSIGYQSEAIAGMADLGIPFDETRGVISNDIDGRVIAPSSNPAEMVAIPGMYCSGWVKRGPAGVIANTMEDAFVTAEAIAKDWESQVPFLDGGRGWDALKDQAEALGLRTVNWDDWQKIDAAEKRRGRDRGKVREKFTSTKEMLDVLN